MFKNDVKEQDAKAKANELAFAWFVNPYTQFPFSYIPRFYSKAHL